jgi:hypothetical protein
MQHACAIIINFRIEKASNGADSRISMSWCAVKNQIRYEQSKARTDMVLDSPPSQEEIGRKNVPYISLETRDQRRPSSPFTTCELSLRADDVIGYVEGPFGCIK